MARRDALLRLTKSLLARRHELLRRLGKDFDDMAQSDLSGSGDSADAAFGSTGEELACRLAELEAKELTQIERALARLRQGSYGRCEGCNKKIPVMRLSALPYSTLCIVCQREVERDADWLESRRAAANWGSVRDSDVPSEPEIRLSDLEVT
jgi:DnaK suppressor protein